MTILGISYVLNDIEMPTYIKLDSSICIVSTASPFSHPDNADVHWGRHEEKHLAPQCARSRGLCSNCVLASRQ
jgi:hypothetical protein